MMTMPRAIARAEWVWVGVASFVILAISISPFVWGILTTPPDLHYSGIIWQPSDSSLLLSTMWQGVRGHWLYLPPYVTESGAGAFFYPQYVLLGHLAAWLGLEPIILFH